MLFMQSVVKELKFNWTVSEADSFSNILTKWENVED